MFLCLAFDSVFLSSLAIPPTINIKTLPQLAEEIVRGDYQCKNQFGPDMMHKVLQFPNSEHIKVIAKNCLENNRKFTEASPEDEENVAYINILSNVESYDATFLQNYFIFENNFFEFTTSIILRKRFCCKEMIDTFVHRFLASGIFDKFNKDNNYVSRIKQLSNIH